MKRNSSSPRRRPSRRRPIGLLALRVAWGTLLLARPGRAIRLLGGQDTRASIRVARILGARHAAECVMEMTGTTRWLAAGAAVDALHGLSGIAFAALSPRWRRPATLDAIGAFAMAGTGARAARRASGSR